MSSSKDDFGALRCQFNVSLRGVFDIQIAQMELDRRKGRQLPERLKLEDIVAEYSKKKAEFLTEGKDALRVSLLETIAYWVPDQTAWVVAWFEKYLNIFAEGEGGIYLFEYLFVSNAGNCLP